MRRGPAPPPSPRGGCEAQAGSRGKPLFGRDFHFCFQRRKNELLGRKGCKGFKSVPFIHSFIPQTWPKHLSVTGSGRPASCPQHSLPSLRPPRPGARRGLQEGGPQTRAVDSRSDALLCGQYTDDKGGVLGSRKIFSVLGDRPHSSSHRLVIVRFHLFVTRFIPDTQISLLPGPCPALWLLSLVSV